MIKRNFLKHSDKDTCTEEQRKMRVDFSSEFKEEEPMATPVKRWKKATVNLESYNHENTFKK